MPFKFIQEQLQKKLRHSQDTLIKKDVLKLRIKRYPGTWYDWKILEKKEELRVM